MGLLAGAEHASEMPGEEDSDESDSPVMSKEKMKVPLTREDKKAMALLIVLCASLRWHTCWSFFFSFLLTLGPIARLDPRCSCVYFYPIHAREARSLPICCIARSGFGCAHPTRVPHCMR